MKESYRKGVAIHSDPEPCEGGREAALEALDRGICRLGIPEVDELRNRESRAPTASRCTEGNTVVCANASASLALRSRRPQACIETSRARTERPRGRPWPVGHGPLGEGDEL